MNALQRELKKLTIAYEKQSRSQKSGENWRSAFHITPPTGWLNDPNGLCFYQDMYHVFFQYSPFDVNGGLKLWGHAVSKDLLNWEYMEAALYPDQPYDCHGVYSGSALTENGNLYLFYTGNVKHSGDYDYINNGRGSNTVMAVSHDGKTFQEKLLLMENKDYPHHLTCHVRDPKVWKENEIYYMVQGARTKDHTGQVILFSSTDKYLWKFETIIKSDVPFGYMWECPDLFELNGQKILCICPQGIPSQDLKYQNVYQAGYFLLSGDFYKDYHLSEFQELDHGFDFYAPQTFTDATNRRILIGWMGAADSAHLYTNPTMAYGWNQALTLPRELIFKNGKVFQEPISELKSLRKQKITGQGSKRIHGLTLYELELKGTDTSFSLTLAEDLLLFYQKEDHAFFMKFTGKSGYGRTCRGTQISEFRNLRAVVDYSSVELFINDGETVFTTRYYPATVQTTLEIKGTQIEYVIWELSLK